MPEGDMNGKGSKPRDQSPGPDGKTPNDRFRENWDAVFGPKAPSVERPDKLREDSTGAGDKT